MEMALHYFPLCLIFFLSQLYAAAEDVQHGMRVFLPVPSVQQIAMQEQLQLISCNSANIVTKTVVNIQEIIWVLERQTGLLILIKATIRYKLYRRLMNEALPLKESGTKLLRKQLEQGFSSL